MGFISKVELKKQLKEKGIKIIKGEYVRKKDIKKVIQAGWEPDLRDNEFTIDGFIQEIADILSQWEPEILVDFYNKFLVIPSQDGTGKATYFEDGDYIEVKRN